MLILNCGGTFNKRYNELNGELEVPFDNYAPERILDTFVNKIDMAGVVYKDSLEMDQNDRKMLASIIAESSEECFVLIHGTDTMDKSAEFLATVFENKTIVLTGAMKPFEIENIEATLNLGMSIGFCKAKPVNGVYICMNGHIEPWDQIEKNRLIGKFEVVR